MTKEKNLRWYFGTEGGQIIGPNDPIHENFKGNPYYSIVREAIQNSMDAVLDDSMPVEVDFEFLKVKKEEYPNLFDIESHIDSCLSFFPDNEDAELLFGEMKDFLNKTISGNQVTSLKCLKISDYNTKGMNYEKNNIQSPFFAFLKATGVSTNKPTGAGGSFGFGKGAYFALSPLKTVLVSTVSENKQHFFEGATRLTTHLDQKGDRCTAFGYYSNGNDEPISIASEIPDLFIRNKRGTDFIIFGLHDEDLKKVSMIKSVLNNFWLTIQRNRLKVRVFNTEINKDNLSLKIEEYFDTEVDSASVNDPENWNPKSYFKAVEYSEVSDNFLVFKKKLKTIGHVEFFVYKDEDLSNKIAYFRKGTYMNVYKRTNNKLNGYSGVFICNDDIGDKILKKMENPAHNEWDKKNYLKQGSPHPQAISAIKEINDFVNNCLDKLAERTKGGSTTVLGLEEWLNIPEDIIGNEDNEGESYNTEFGVKSNKKSEEETGSITTVITGIDEKNKLSTKKKDAKEDFEGQLDPDGDELVSTGVDDEGDTVDPEDPHPNPGNDFSLGSKGNKKSQKLINVEFRAVVQKRGNEYDHVLIIKSNRNVNKAQLDIKVGTDEDSENKSDNARIIYSNMGTIRDNSIENLNLTAGMNKLKIRFDDKLKHSIGVKAYEIR